MRAVAVELFSDWVSNPAESSEVDSEDALTNEELEKYPWLEITKPYIHPGMSHDWDEIKEAIAKGWSEEIGEKLFPNKEAS